MSFHHWHYKQEMLKMSKDNYEENDERMNIIGQNGNDGLHYEGLNNESS